MEEYWQTTIPVSLEPDNLTLEIVVFPFATMVSSVLNCFKEKKEGPCQAHSII
jgi:hypothetical protein